MEGKICLKLDGITKTFQKKRNKVIALEHIDLVIEQGEFVGIIGKSGAGKTTLLHIIGLLSSATKGEYYIGGEDTVNLSEKKKAQYRNKLFGFVLQEYGLIENDSVFENVEIPLNYSKKHYKKCEKRTIISDILDDLGVKSKIDDVCSNLSGGQKQRVAIARALVNDPQIVIADEPTGALDSETAQEFLELMHKINQDLNKTIIMVTHDKNMLKYCNRVIEIEDGKIRNVCVRVQNT